jgi:hypothetical protein
LPNNKNPAAKGRKDPPLMQRRSRAPRIAVCARRDGTGARIVLLVLCAAALCLLATSSRAAAYATGVLPPRPPVAAAGLKLPDYIGVLDYMGERSRTDARAGKSYSYRAAGLALDIDLYNYPPEQLPDGVDSPVLQRQYVQALNAARAAAFDRHAKLLQEDIAPLGSDGSFKALEAVLQLRKPGFSGRTYLWVAAIHGQLLEMRLDVKNGFEDDGHVSRSEVLAALGDTLAHPVAGAAQMAAAPHRNVTILWDTTTPKAERELWMGYLYTRAAQAAKESDDRTLELGEREASFDEEVRARRVAVNLYRSMVRKDPDFHSPYFTDLERVDGAGFLREYVWHYLRSSSWPPPQGLSLHAFDDWRATHLPTHRPVTHGRIAIRLATE